MMDTTAPKKRNPGYESRAKCAAIRKDGGRCLSFAMTDGYCYRHSPNISDEHRRRETCGDERDLEGSQHR